MTKIEEVAQAILAALETQGPDVPFVAGTPSAATLDGVFDLRPVARAAIAAMREPSEAMIEAGYTHCVDIDYNEMPYSAPREAATAAFSAMIDAILAEPQPYLQQTIVHTLVYRAETPEADHPGQ